ncbi:MAG TPA: FtsX-like permease family protein, partial [Gemmatimonadaceae bacterium]
VPGVTRATLQEAVPFAGMSSWPIYVEGIDSVRSLGEFDFNSVSAEYFATMGTRILEGRSIETTDVDGAQPVLVLGQSMAKALWPNQSAIGRCVRVGLKPEAAPCRYVVGVAEDIHSQSIEPESKLFYYYMPAAQWRPNRGGLFVRGQDARRLVEPIRRRLQAEMPGSSFVTVSRLSDYVDTKARTWIVGATVFTIFGAMALALAAIGLYSVIAYGVTQRRHELGVRLALGAGRARLIGFVVMQGVRVAAAGIVIGGAIAFAAGRWVQPLLFDQPPHDPKVFAVVIGTMLVVAVAASAIPARRAAALDPKDALVSE